MSKVQDDYGPSSIDVSSVQKSVCIGCSCHVSCHRFPTYMYRGLNSMCPDFSLYPLIAADEQDIIDEALYYFKANVFFKSFEVKVCDE